MVTVDQGQAKQSYEYFPPLPLSFLPLFFASLGNYWMVVDLVHTFITLQNQS